MTGTDRPPCAFCYRTPREPDSRWCRVCQARAAADELQRRGLRNGEGTTGDPVTAPRLCTRCSSEPRMPGQRWGRTCLTSLSVIGGAGVPRGGRWPVQWRDLKARQQRPYLYDYDEVATLLRLSPRYVKKLCDTRRLAYAVRTWRHGVYQRRKRYIPWSEVVRWMMHPFEGIIARDQRHPIRATRKGSHARSE